MSRRYLASGLLILSMAACDSAPKGNSTVSSGDATTKQVTEDGKVDCAIGRGGTWAHNCLVDRSGGPDGALLTFRHPDGGFRRFRIVTDGRGLVPADGAEQMKLTLLEKRRIEIAIGPDRYRMAVTIAAPLR